MSAQPQQHPKPPPPREPPPPRYSTETRLAIVETRWQDLIPTLATKSDLREATTKLQADTALVRKDIEAVEERLNGKIDAVMNKIIIRVTSITVAAIIATGTIFTLIQKFVS